MGGIRARKDFGFRSTVGRGRDGDRKISQTRRLFFSDAPAGRKHRRIECTNGVIRTNVITARFSGYMQRTREQGGVVARRTKRKREITLEHGIS